jgi:integrase/recombinase XerD
MGKKALSKQAQQFFESLGPKVKLLGLVKYNGTWGRYPAAYSGSGRVLNNVLIINGQHAQFPVCRYELRYRENGIDKRANAGGDATAAEEQRAIVARKLAVKRAATESNLKLLPQDESITPMMDPTITNEEAAKRVPQAEVLANFVEDRELQQKFTAAKCGRLAWNELIEANKIVANIEYLDDVTRAAILRFHKSMRDRKLADITVAFRHKELMRILKFAGVDTKGKEKNFPATPQYELALPTVYTSAQIKQLFAEADDNDQVALRMLLKLGLRDKELYHAEFSDINFDMKVFKVQGKKFPNFEEFKVKDHEQREIPIPQCLLDLLRIWQDRHPGQSLIVPNKDGGPNKSILERLKNCAYRAGLGCGKCAGCNDPERNACSDFTLQKFRRTCITGLLQSGIDMRTVQAIAGHANIETTMRYLRPVSAKSLHMAVTAINWENLDIGL